MKMLLIKCLLVLISIRSYWAYKILIAFAVPSPSHGILSEGLARHLLAAGHEVTHISPFPIKNPPKNLRNIDVSENEKFIDVDAYDVKGIMNKEVNLQDQTVYNQVLDKLWTGTAQLGVMQKLMNDPNEEFDIVVAEWLYSELISGMATVFNCPLIWVSTMDTDGVVLSLINEYLNPAYTFHHLTKDYSFTFLDRVHQLWSISKIWYYKWINADKEEENFKQIYGPIVAKKGRKLPSLHDVKHNASLMLGNTHLITGDSVALPQNYKHIGGYHVKVPVDPLPQNLIEIFDKATNGVIYFSLGSNVKSKSLPDDIKNELLTVFGSLKETVIWKFEKPLPDLPKNVHIIQWAPQQSILAHPKCVLFITHGGILSTIETLHAGKPIVGIPFFADQYSNVNKAVAKGFSVRVDFDMNVAKNLNVSIREALENPRYQQRAKELSDIFHDRLVPPGKELVHWVEHVVKTKGAPHLRSAALHVSWYKKMYLDLLLVISLALASFFIVIKCLFASIRVEIHTKEKTS